MSLDDIDIPKSANERLKPFHQTLLRAFIKLGVGESVTLNELRATMGLKPDEQQQLRRRIKELQDAGWPAGKVSGRRDGQFLYALESANPTLEQKHAHSINATDRAAVLHQANGRCRMCGRTIAADSIKLVVDHKVPRDWGGDNDRTNLEALCEECNGGKKNFFATLDPDVMRKCMKHNEVHKRIGELLKAFDGKYVEAWLISIVAQEYEWTRRIRELRDLGWKYKSKAEHDENGRRKGQNSYKLVHSEPWPDDIKAAIREAAAKRGSKSLS